MEGQVQVRKKYPGPGPDLTSDSLLRQAQNVNNRQQHINVNHHKLDNDSDGGVTTASTTTTTRMGTEPRQEALETRTLSFHFFLLLLMLIDYN